MENKVWWENVSIEYKNKNFYKNKITQKSILSEIHQETNVNFWTNTQKHWQFKLNIPIDDFLTKKMNTIEKINDFRTKFALNFWSEKMNKVCLCGKDFSIFHFISDCEVVHQWMLKIHPEPNELLYSQFNPVSKRHLHLWLIKWCAWKNYHEEMNKLIIPENGVITINSLGFYKLVKTYEKMHLIYLILTTYKKKIPSDWLKETECFFFFRLNKKFHIIEKEHHLNRFLT